MAKHVIVIGSGIVGLAAGYQLLRRYPGAKLTILEKEASWAQHQTGHNSGVLHSGIYYKPGSQKARNCRAGKAAMETFCLDEGIPFEQCGKVIVATHENELGALKQIFDRGIENGINCELIGPERLAEIEPHASGVQAVHVPEAGIVDYKKVCDKLIEVIRELGGECVFDAEVSSINSNVVETTKGDFEADVQINCAGLYSDKVAKATGADLAHQIIPFRGEYFDLKPEAHRLVNHLIYPVPDPDFPFLGVHFTRMINGGIECGPNAVFAFAREGYKKTDLDIGELFDSLSYPGFQKLAFKYWQAGVGEIWRSVNKSAFVTALQKLVPEIKSSDLVAAPSGVRAQAVARNGTMVDDFLLIQNGSVLNVCNAPSPAATASLNIGSEIVDRVAEFLD